MLLSFFCQVFWYIRKDLCASVNNSRERIRTGCRRPQLPLAALSRASTARVIQKPSLPCSDHIASPEDDSGHCDRHDQVECYSEQAHKRWNRCWHSSNARLQDTDMNAETGWMNEANSASPSSQAIPAIMPATDERPITAPRMPNEPAFRPQDSLPLGVYHCNRLAEIP